MTRKVNLMKTTKQYLTFAPHGNRSSEPVDEEIHPLLAPGEFTRLKADHRRKSSVVLLNADNCPRLVKRDLPHFQSNQTVAILNRKGDNAAPLRYNHDWFHAFLRWETKRSVFLMISGWTLVNLFFGLVYRSIDGEDPSEDCGLSSEPGKVITFGGAFAFSLETCTTVGYGLPGGKNAFFENCHGLQAAIYFQMVFSMLYNAFLFAFFFSRLARAETRGNQVLFSNKAIIEYRNGKWLFLVRIYDLDAAHPVVEAHVRLYVVSWMDYENQDNQPHLLHTMRLVQPNDELGAMLFTSVPSTVTHHIDAYSPLTPMHLRDDENLVQRHGLALREVDRMVENNGGIPCPVCGETYGTFQNLNRHIKYNSLTESHDKVPVEGSHRDPKLVIPGDAKPFEMAENEIRTNLIDKEVMVVVEGIEPLISGTFQALQSYTLDDIVFGGKFSPCMSQRDGQVFVDLDKFHQIVPGTPKTSVRTRKIFRF